MEAGHQYMGYPGQPVDDMGTVRNNLAEHGAGRKGFVAFTLDFAAMAADTFLSILKQVVVAHNLSPHQTDFRKRRTRARGLPCPIFEIMFKPAIPHGYPCYQHNP
jgi:hypothetical protein